MTSVVAKRKQLVNQLRKAHFPFGFDQNQQKSQYITKYPQYPIQVNPHNKNDTRKNNFSIGNQNDTIQPDKHYQSEFKEKYPEYQNTKKQQLIGAKNTGVNNIVFGYQNKQDQDEKYNTNYKDEYNKKNTENYHKPQPINNRKRNIQFGDTLIDFTTTYGQVYDKKNPISNAPLIDRAEIRKSNLMLGNDQSNFQTQNNMTYKNSGTQNYVAHKPTITANIQLGHDSVNYASEHKQRFHFKDAKRQVVQPELIRDFRSAHFHFGFPTDKNNAESEAKAQFVQKTLEPVHVEERKPNNINLNIDGNGYFESCYGKEFHNWGTLPKTEINKHGRNDNILIGTDMDPAERYISEAKQNFVKKDINLAQPIKAQSTFALGQQQGDFRTHNQLTHDNKFPQRENNKVTQQDINRMKALNIVTGFQNGSYNLHSSEYGKKLGDRGMLDKDTLDKMKNTNIVLETVPNTNEFNGKTSYKSSYYYKLNSEC